MSSIGSLTLARETQKTDRKATPRKWCFLILGGYGNVGKLLVRHLLKETSHDTTLILAGRNLNKAVQFRQQMVDETIEGNAYRLSTMQIDACDSRSFRSALESLLLVPNKENERSSTGSRKELFVINAAPISKATEIIMGVLLNIRTRVKNQANNPKMCYNMNLGPYLDLQLSREKMKVLARMKPQLENAGQPIITEAGFHPGLPLALAKFTSHSLVKSLKSSNAKKDQILSTIPFQIEIKKVFVSGYLNIGDSAPYAPDSTEELLDAFLDYQGHTFQKGAWTTPSDWDIRTVNFGPEIGSRTCYSMFLDELLCIPENTILFPHLQTAGFYMAGSGWFVDYFVFPIILIGLAVVGSRKWWKVQIGRLLWWSMQQAPPPCTCAIQAEVWGILKKPTSIEQQNAEQQEKVVKRQVRLEHPDAYEMTVIPVVAFLLQYLDGSIIIEPGVHLMGQVVTPQRLMDDMERLGIRRFENDSA